MPSTRLKSRAALPPAPTATALWEGRSPCSRPHPTSGISRGLLRPATQGSRMSGEGIPTCSAAGGFQARCAAFAREGTSSSAEEDRGPVDTRADLDFVRYRFPARPLSRPRPLHRSSQCTGRATAKRYYPARELKLVGNGRCSLRALGSFDPRIPLPGSATQHVLQGLLHQRAPRRRDRNLVAEGTLQRQRRVGGLEPFGDKTGTSCSERIRTVRAG